jgi:uncharacterized protein (TIGR03067 family)
MPAKALAQARLLIDGDRFRMESPEATYEGVLTIDVERTRHTSRFISSKVQKPGNESCGIYELTGDRLMLCLGLAGSRARAGSPQEGQWPCLQQLRRSSARRPANVTGGTPQPVTVVAADREDPSAFDVAMTPLLRRLEGEWDPVKLVMDGKPMPDEWLSFGSRTAVGNEVKVVFGGQVMVHAKVRIDETAAPMAVDYLCLKGRQSGTVSRGIMEWVGDEVRFHGRSRRAASRGFHRVSRHVQQWKRRDRTTEK